MGFAIHGPDPSLGPPRGMSQLALARSQPARGANPASPRDLCRAGDAGGSALTLGLGLGGGGWCGLALWRLRRFELVGDLSVSLFSCQPRGAFCFHAKTKNSKG